MEAEKLLLMKTFKSVSAWHIDEVPELDNILIKEANDSELIRRETNKKFNQKKHGSVLHEKVWVEYSLGITMAPDGTEMQAAAYGNRSAVLLHFSKFKESIQDIDRALSITNSNDLKTKLLCRKVKCLAAIGFTGDIEKILQKALFFCNKCELSKKSYLLKLIEDAKSYSNYTKSQSSSYSEKPSITRILQSKKGPGDFSSVSVAYNNKVGNHLVAAKDIVPGEVILIEKPFLSTFNSEKERIHCSHCFVHCWAAIPCQLCHLCFFCSEKCKKEAWEQYHSVQCIPLAICKTDTETDCLLQASTRAVITAVKEAGSISKLKSKLKFMDESKGNFLKDSFDNGDIQNNGFKIFYKLKSLKSSEENKTYSESITRLIIVFARLSSFFGRPFGKQECKHLMKNQDVVFIGSLLLKTISSMANNGCTIYENDIYTGLRCIKILNLSVFATLIKHSCDPNVVVIFNPENHNTVVYAVKPIKKNEQIFSTTSYQTFYDTTKFLRHLKIDSKSSNCKCEACVKDWPPFFKIQKPQEYLNAVFEKPFENELLNKYKDIIKGVEMNDRSVYTEEVIANLAKGVEVAVSRGSHPSVISCLLIKSLKKIFNKLYGFHSLVPGECRVDYR